MQNLLEGDEYDFRYNLGVATNTCAVRLEDREEIVSQLANHYAILQIKGELDQILCAHSVFSTYFVPNLQLCDHF